jgi:hypothetical protein
MSNELATKRDSIDDAMELLSAVRGVQLKFQNSGMWAQGYEGESADKVGDCLVVEMAEGWRFLMKGRPQEYAIREPGMPRPPRPSSFEDESSWPIYNGEPRDPWSYVVIIHMIYGRNRHHL